MAQNPGNSFTLLSLLYIILLAFVYFIKPRAKNLETKIYNLVIITCLVGNTISLGTYYFMMHLDVYPILNEIFARGYLLFVLTFIALISYYVLIISIDEKAPIQKKNKQLQYSRLCVLLFTVIAFFFSLVLPIEYVSDSGIVYSTGSAVKFVFTSTRLYAFMWIVVLLLRIKRIKEKKYWPMILYIILGSIVSYIQGNHPEYLLSTSMMVFCTFLMYFTIENPDVKLINELELAKNQAEKANRAKSDFLSSMSHEIRTPLNAIVCLSEIINSSDDIKEIHEDSKDVVNASHTLLEIVNGVLDISRIEADKMEIVNTTYNPVEEFEDLSKLIETRIGEKDIKFRTNFAEDIPNCLYGDKGKIKQIVTNILSNAVKYTEKGYIDFDVKCINKNDACKLTISIKDTGRGIKKEQMDKLFTKFNRLDEDKNTTIEGTGLGLAITKSLVELMGGKIVVDSTYGEGSKFTIFIEQQIASENMAMEEKIITNQVYNNKKVLVVDDNKLNIKVASKIFKELNIEVDEANSGFECIDKIENGNKYDIIFMDIMMPKMSGVETLKKLKNIKDFSIPVVALTADAMEGKSNKYLEVGFDDYITKPINRDKLNQILNKLLKIDNQNIKDDNQEREDENITEDKVIPVTDEDVQKLKEVEEKQSSETKKGNIEFLKENDIDVDASIELLGDIEMFNETLKDFIEESKERIPRLIKNKMSENMSDYAIDVHAMKSDSKYLGFKKLAELSYEHEMKSKASDYEYVALHFEELIEEYNRIKKIIDNYL